MSKELKFTEDELLSEIELEWIVTILEGLVNKTEYLDRMIYSSIRTRFSENKMYHPLRDINLKGYNKMLDDMTLKSISEAKDQDKIAERIAEKLKIYRKLVYEQG